MDKYQLIKKYKIDFLKNITDECGAMKKVIRNKKADELIIHLHNRKDGRLWGSTTQEKLLKLIEKNRGVFEVLNSYPQKVYFDIDNDNAGDNFNINDYVNKIKNIINEFFRDAEYAISGSYSQEKNKASLHIILNNYLIQNDNDRDYMKVLSMYLNKNKCADFDWKVYTKNRNMKCINQTKSNDTRIQEIIENADYKKHLITCFFNFDNIQPLPTLTDELKEDLQIIKSNKTFNIGLLPKLKLVLPNDFNINNTTLEAMLSLLPLDKTFNHDYTHLIARYCYTEDINNLNLFLAWIQKKHGDPLPINIKQKWTRHWNNLNKYPKVYKNRIDKILYNYYPNLKKDINIRNFENSFKLPTDKFEFIDTIDQSCYKTCHKFKVFNIGMGGGKTYQTIHYLNNKEFIWIAPNISLARNTTKRFDLYGIKQPSYYQDFTRTQKLNGILDKQDSLMTTIHSLHYINKTYKTVIIDEIETLFLNCIEGQFIEQGNKMLKLTIWNKFINILKNADEVIILDAFITTKTINLIKNIASNFDNDLIIYQRKTELSTRTIEFTKDFELTINDIITKLNNNNKIFIFYPYKNRFKEYPSMETLHKTLIEKTNKKGQFYNADIDDKIKKELKDIDKNWSNNDFVITNNIITCGVSYENNDYDYKYLFIASHNTPRDVIQVSLRVRNLNSKKIVVNYLGRMNQETTFVNDIDRMNNCIIYKQLLNDIWIEKKAPIKKSIQLFCDKAHYKRNNITQLIDKKITEEIQDLFEMYNMTYSYATIDDISYEEAEILEKKILSMEATLMDKMKLKKYFFKLKFKNTEDKELEYLYDNKFFFFINKINEDTTLFNDIMKFNNITDTLFPNDIKKIKLNDDILENIFKNFHFRSLNKNSSKKVLLKEIYNKSFGLYIYKSIADNNKHFEFVKTDLEIDEMYKYIKKNTKQTNRPRLVNVEELDL